jgi:chemotaxis protein CheD
VTVASAQTQPPAFERRIHVVQGEFFVTRDPTVMLTTILGSCVAACLYDPVRGVGGMNHFLLPDSGGRAGADPLRFGVQSMELLVNALLREGAERHRLHAKLFGGGRMMDGLTDVGDQNAAFAERFLRDEGMTYMGGSLRGESARRVQFWPVSGRARQLPIQRDTDVFAAERVRPAPPPPAETGGVELF